MIAAVLGTTGCGTAAHDAALAQAKAWARAHDDAGRVQCSSGFKSIAGRSVKSTDFICLVRHEGAICDELYVRKVHGRWVASLRRRGVDCVLPL